MPRRSLGIACGRATFPSLVSRLGTIACGVVAALFALSAVTLAAPPAKKKKKPKPKHTTSAPAAPDAGSAAPGVDPDLYRPPPEPAESASPEPAPSAAPATAPPEPATTKEPSPAEASPTTAPPPSSAAPKSLPPVSLALLGGWGYAPAARLGFGGRLGYTAPFHIYVGATFVYHLGESENGGTASFFYPGGELGYELTFGPVVVRPYAGAGALFLSTGGASPTPSTKYFAAWPGVTLAYTITPWLFAGLDGRVTISGYDFISRFGTVGARF